jgi:predicted nucleotide-binding protein
VTEPISVPLPQPDAAIDLESPLLEAVELVLRVEPLFHDLLNAVVSNDAPNAEMLLLRVAAERSKPVPEFCRELWKLTLNAAEAIARLPLTTDQILEAHYVGALEHCQAIGKLAAEGLAAKRAIHADQKWLLGELESPLELFETILMACETMAAGAGHGLDAEKALIAGDVQSYLLHLEKVLEAHQPGLVRLMSHRETEVAKVFLPMMTRMRKSLQNRVQNLRSTYRLDQRYLKSSGEKVFVIHGHAEESDLETLLGIIHAQGYEAKVLRDLPRVGHTLMQRFLGYANECFCAVCLMTEDDQVENQGKSYHQARPNVVFELGWFYGRFGPESLCIVCVGNPVIPSDLGGVMQMDLESGSQDLVETLTSMRLR